MLQVMTPEQQFVSLAALGPSMLTRSTPETKTCNSAAGQGLVYPSDRTTRVQGGTWSRLFKNDYLGAPDSNGVSAVNMSSNVVQAINCLDDFDSTREEPAGPTRRRWRRR